MTLVGAMMAPDTLGGGGGLKGYRVCEGLTVNTWLNGGMCQH